MFIEVSRRFIVQRKFGIIEQLFKTINFLSDLNISYKSNSLDHEHMMGYDDIWSIQQYITKDQEARN